MSRTNLLTCVLVLGGCHLALPLAPARDAALADGEITDGEITDGSISPETSTPPDAKGDLPSGPGWWDGAYAHRLPLVITEAADGPLPAGYSVVLVLDTAALVAAQQLQASGDDLRIVRWDGTAHHEHDRRVIEANTGATAVWFKTDAAIDGESRDYTLYHGNPGAGAPPAHWSDSMGADAPSRVYLAADDFEEHVAGDCPDGWTPCDSGQSGHPWQVQGSTNRYLETTSAVTYIFAGQQQWTDVSMEARVWSEYPDGCPGIASRVQTLKHLVYTGYNCVPSDPQYPQPFGHDNVTVWVRPNADNYYPLHGAQALGVVIQPKEWHRVRVAWTGLEVRLFHDGTFAGKELTVSPDVGGAGRVGLFSAYTNAPVRADEVVVRRFVDPEPTVTVDKP